MNAAAELYARYRRALGDVRLPAAAVDLDALEANARVLLEPVRRAGKTLRIATKSIRCAGIVRRLLDGFPDVCRGLMAYSTAEAAFLVEQGFDDLLIAYPTSQAVDAAALAELAAAGRTVSIAVDALEHLELLAEAARARGVRIPVVVDADMSYRPWSGRVHLGVRRSPLTEPEAVVELAARAAEGAGIQLLGVLAYEAQIAGVGDRSPFSPLTNRAKRTMKALSRGDVAARRRAIAEGFAARGLPLKIFNGGGSGSVSWSSDEAVLTEVTAGSGFLASHLFDHYQDLELTPAAFFALSVTRHPAPGIVTCHGGGYVASGEAGPDRLPMPWLPEGLSLLPREGAGEVQTPLKVPAGVSLNLGDAVFFRHAKAGELAERFDECHLIRGDQVEERAPTYRGEGATFG